MKGVHILLVLSFLALASSFASASDPSPLQDFCIGVNGSSNGVFVNGKFCKDPRLATAEDFFFSGFNIRKNTSNPLGTTVTLAYDAVLPGVNTLGVSVFRVDYAPNGGLYPPHIHPRSSEILTVLEGRLYAGFVTSAPENRLIGKVLNPGDGFVFPQGLVHFHYNIGRTNAVAFAAFGSQNPGIVFFANAVFGSKPRINPDVLAKAFQLDRNTVRDLQSKFGPSN